MEETVKLEQKLKARDVARGIGRLMATGIKDEFNFRKHPIKATLKTLFVGAIGAGMYFSVQNARVEDYNSQLTQEVSILADKNQDRATTSDEWANVYKELGVRYDAFSSNPTKDLTVGQKESFVNSHK
jgi:hypothetical protein